MIAIAGMGIPGRFGTPELTVVARELCWALGQQGKQHLATILIGAGHGSLPVEEAVSAWIRGIKHAVTGSCYGDCPRLHCVTFVERNPRRVIAIDNAIQTEMERLEKRKRLSICYTPLPKAAIKALHKEQFQQSQARLKEEQATLEKQYLAQEKAAHKKGKSMQSDPDEEGTQDSVPTRITITYDEDAYRFGAITREAAVPERQIPVDCALIEETNREIVAATEPARQRDRGSLLERLLFPEDLRGLLTSTGPLVLMLDRTTARIHWETLVASAPRRLSDDASQLLAQTARQQNIEDIPFLGMVRGLSRQLRTSLASIPEPPPPPLRVLRVLVVANPAKDAPLAGAEAEGVLVADLFERFNSLCDDRPAFQSLSKNRVEVVRLFGPAEATRANVLEHLLLRHYDVLHFAGHCVYDTQNPARSGWIFSREKNERITANELNRVDRIPKFIFSNACQSGVTSDRAEERNDLLAPTFAEAFFGRGVANFVCTAWPVDDIVAMLFAETLYASLLGLAGDKPFANLPANQRVGQHYTRRVKPDPMHVTMRKARLATATLPRGVRTWGAYQHYGNSFFRFFETGESGKSIEN